MFESIELKALGASTETCTVDSEVSILDSRVSFSCNENKNENVTTNNSLTGEAKVCGLGYEDHDSKIENKNTQANNSTDDNCNYPDSGNNNIINYLHANDNDVVIPGFFEVKEEENSDQEEFYEEHCYYSSDRQFEPDEHLNSSNTIANNNDTGSNNNNNNNNNENNENNDNNDNNDNIGNNENNTIVNDNNNDTNNNNLGLTEKLSQTTMPNTRLFWVKIKYQYQHNSNHKRNAGDLASLESALISALGAFIFIFILSLTEYLFNKYNTNQTVNGLFNVLGSFGATSVIEFGASSAPLAMPRNLLFSQIFVTLIGTICSKYIAEPMGTRGFALPFAVGLSLVIMMLTKTVHPPAGGTVAVLVLASPTVAALGWYMFIPVIYFGFVALLVAVLINNLSTILVYPHFWFTENKSGLDPTIANIVRAKKVKIIKEQMQTEVTKKDNKLIRVMKNNTPYLTNMAKFKGMDKMVYSRLFWKKWTGIKNSKPPKFPTVEALIVAFIGSFLFIGVLSAVNFTTEVTPDYVLVLASFGATAVLYFGAPSSPLAQPRNSILGQLIACTVGILFRLYIADPMDTTLFALPFGCSVTLFLQILSRSVHPPAGGTVAIAILSSPAINELGYGLYVPVIYSVAVSLVIAIIVNNLNSKVIYPKYWLY